MKIFKILNISKKSSTYNLACNFIVKEYLGQKNLQKKDVRQKNALQKNALQKNAQSSILSILTSLLFCCLVSSCFAPSVLAEKFPITLPVNKSRLSKKALVETTKGPFEMEFFIEEAPITTANFQHLVKKGFYEGLSFHKFIPNFIIQGGDPLGNGQGGPGYTVPAETSEIPHEIGTVGAPRRSSAVNPERDSNGSQFYICLNRSKHLDGLYTVFAKIISGMEVVRKLRSGDKIIKISLSQVD